MKTRFERELFGELGAFWEKEAQREMDEAVANADADAEVDENGAIRWKSNGNYLMDDICEMLEYAGYDFSRNATRQARDEQVAEQIAECREKQKLRYSEETVNELRAAFGEGTTVVDLLTGRRIEL